ncbi:hypothetical protein [Mesorhizobium sp. NZP2077]|uniref:hypothetical protein n=1 Tax=Mesorhizobium sp. NZP2077 TaxID=2483404 RepID=UPI0015582550|nr:hypothetical protein [Mesorhizobium sp. NZP2077]QKD17142.1 hypothetical protein HGP13_20015 [Mesorhizobium sp. NZP2077]
MPKLTVPAAGEAMPAAEVMPIIGRFSRRALLSAIAAVPAMGAATAAFAVATPPKVFPDFGSAALIANEPVETPCERVTRLARELSAAMEGMHGGEWAGYCRSFVRLRPHCAAQSRGAVMSAATNPAGEKIQFTDLEPLICDADNMIDVLMDMCEIFSNRPDDNDKVIVTGSEAARLFFVAGQAESISHKLKKAYYQAWEQRTRRRRLAHCW